MNAKPFANNSSSSNTSTLSRRQFVQRGALTAATVSAFSVMPNSKARAQDEITVGVIGCGGRGKGAAENAIRADDAVRIVAAADLFEHRLDSLRERVAKHGQEVPRAHCFTGWDAYQQVIDSDVDYIILATPPVFRPPMLEAAVQAGKHVFMEKPAAIDPPGIRRIIQAGEAAREKGLSIVAGTQRRHEDSYVTTIKRLQEGAIGDILALHVYWCGGPIAFRGDPNQMSEMEYQINNWYHYLWLSGDHIVEQHVHNIDIGCWVMDDYPMKAIGFGGQGWKRRGNIWDHHAVDFEFANGVHMHSLCEQMPGGINRVEEIAVGSKGRSNCRDWIGGPNEWKYEGDYQNPYVQEHINLIASIREGEGLNEAATVAKSTLVGIMGRTAGYEQREVTWDEIYNSSQSFTPAEFAMGDHPIRPAQIPSGEPFDPSAGWNPDPS